MGLVLAALDNWEGARYWGSRCHRRDLELPRAYVDGSFNYACALRAARQDWGDLGRIARDWWDRGMGNEFNSPLYLAKWLASLALGSARSTNLQTHLALQRLTALLSLQAVAAPRRPQHRGWQFGTVPGTAKVRRWSSLHVPPTGCRVNGGSVCDPGHETVLAALLGFEWTPHRKFDPLLIPTTPAEYQERGTQLYNPSGFAHVAKLARPSLPPDADGWFKLCRDFIEGDGGNAKRLLQPLDTFRLPRGIRRFVIFRKGRSHVATALDSGTSALPTRQKPCVAAAGLWDNRYITLAPCDFRIPTRPCRVNLQLDINGGANTAVAHGDVPNVMRRLPEDWDQRITFSDRQPPELATR